MQILEPHVGLGISGHELADAPIHVMESDRIDRRHPNPTRHVTMQGANLVLQGEIAFNQCATSLVVEGAFGRQDEGALGPVDQLDAEPLLHLVDQLASAGLRHVVLVRGSREAALAHNVTEDLQGAQVHFARAIRKLDEAKR